MASSVSARESSSLQIVSLPKISWARSRITGQAEVTGAATRVQDLLIHAVSIIPHPQSKPPLVIMNFHFDPLRVRVPKCIAQRLCRNSIDFVADQRSEDTYCALHAHGKKLGNSRSEFFSRRGGDRGRGEPGRRITMELAL